MSKNDKNIDAYSKALLDKKTEYNDELKKPKVVQDNVFSFRYAS